MCLQIVFVYAICGFPAVKKGSKKSSEFPPSETSPFVSTCDDLAPGQGISMFRPLGCLCPCVEMWDMFAHNVCLCAVWLAPCEAGSDRSRGEGS